VRFTPEGSDQTTVTLEHRLLHKLVGGEAIRDSISGGGGWSAVLAEYAKAVANEG
jgi:hypothetical protein